MAPPVPIPNTVVKHINAESTWLETAWEDRKLPVKRDYFRVISFFYIVIVDKQGTWLEGEMPVACHPVRYSGFAVSDCDRPGRIGNRRLEQERLLQGSLFFVLLLRGLCSDFIWDEQGQLPIENTLALLVVPSGAKLLLRLRLANH